MKRFFCRFFYLTLVFGIAFSFQLLAQPNYGPVRNLSSGEMLEEVRKLQRTGRVLYIAAHPDDENTRMLAWLAGDRKYETAYLSLTRGDGGQNLIGAEVREGLGLIRTQELLAARRVDGARQYFTRANDFGYSKTPEETFTKWQRDSLLADVVWVIRFFRPDLIITRFNPTPSPTHGHHTASAQLAVEAYAAAADPQRFPEQLKWVKPHQVKRVYWNTSWFFFGREDFDKTGFLPLEVGSYNAVLGTGYGEIAAESRSMHKSQGFGSARQRGRETEYFKLLAGDSTANMFDGITDDWSRLKGTAALQAALQAAEKAYSIDKPEAMLPELLNARTALMQLPRTVEVTDALSRLERLLGELAGIWSAFTADKFSYTHGDTAQLRLNWVKRAPVQVELLKVEVKALRFEGADQLPYRYETVHYAEERSSANLHESKSWNTRIVVDKQLPLSAPFWLRGKLDAGFFDLPDARWVGHTENPASWILETEWRIEAGKQRQTISLRQPVYYRWTDPAEGERYRPVEVLAAADLQFDQAHYFSLGYREVLAELTISPRIAVTGRLQLQLPEGWLAQTADTLLQLKAGQELRFQIRLRPGKNASSGRLAAHLLVGSDTLKYGLQRINYLHLPQQVLLPAAEVPLQLFDIKTSARKIGYIEGAGDAGKSALVQLGYSVDELDPAKLSATLLANYQTIVLGVRAYNTVQELANKQAILHQWVAAGGTLVVQYNTSQSLLTPKLAPYNLKLGRDRITDEASPVELLASKHRVLNHPNPITKADFEGWVQERGLYFPSSWDSSFVPILRMNDPGEKPTDGALLVAAYEKGCFVYTGLSFFRQLPAGVPGAWRLWVNLMEAQF